VPSAEAVFSTAETDDSSKTNREMAHPKILTEISLFTKTNKVKGKTTFRFHNEQYNSKEPPQPQRCGIINPSVTFNMPHNGADHAIGIHFGF
jgi:hypothetical protein